MIGGCPFSLSMLAPLSTFRRASYLVEWALSKSRSDAAP